MSSSLPPTELILTQPPRSLGSVELDWTPQPGAQVLHNGQAYTVLERRHRYQFHASRYHLHKIDLYVQATPATSETSRVGDRWVVGDATCRYSAQSEIIRCAVNPDGPCQNCSQYQRRGDHWDHHFGAPRS